MINLMLIWSIVLGIVAVPLLFYSHFFSRNEENISNIMDALKIDPAGFLGFVFLWLHFLLLMVVTLEGA